MGRSPKAASGPAIIELAKVTGVNVRQFTIDAFGVLVEHPFYNVPFSSGYAHSDHPGGIYAMPEVGAYCYICTTSEPTQFVLAWVPNPNTTILEGQEIESVDGDTVRPDFRANRDFLEPGDIYLGTVDGNKIIARKGGIIQVGATSLASTLYIPIENTIRDFFQRYQAYSPLGEIDWGHAAITPTEIFTQTTSTPTGASLTVDEQQALNNAMSTPVLVKYSIKDLAQEDVSEGHYTVELRVGRLTEEMLDPEADFQHFFANKALRERESDLASNDRGVISLTVYCHDEGANKDKVTYAFQLNRDGDNFIFSRGHVHVEVAKTLYANVKEGVKIEFGAAEVRQAVIEFTATDEFKVAVQSALIDALGEIKLRTPGDVVLDAEGNVILGAGANDVVPLGNALLEFFVSGFTCSTSFGPSGPMLPAAKPGFQAALSTKVKVKK